MSQKIKHSKIKNTGLLFEILTRQVTADILNNKESKSSIAEKVSDSLGMPCNRKLVRRVLNEKRSSKLNKLR